MTNSTCLKGQVPDRAGNPGNASPNCAPSSVTGRFFRGGNGEPERKLFQAVIVRAVLDALYEGHSPEGRREKVFADRWLRSRSPEFHMVCDLAGMDGKFIGDRYRAGQIDARWLRKQFEADA